MEITRDGNMACTRVGTLWLAAVGERPISDDTWHEYLEQSASSVRLAGPFHGILLWAPKHGPSAAQRKMLTGEFADAVRIDTQRRVALISESALVRGTITAINWFTRVNTAAFAPRHAQRALDWLAQDIAFDRLHARRVLDEIVGAVEVRVLRSGS